MHYAIDDLRHFGKYRVFFRTTLKLKNIIRIFEIAKIIYQARIVILLNNTKHKLPLNSPFLDRVLFLGGSFGNGI